MNFDKNIIAYFIFIILFIIIQYTKPLPFVNNPIFMLVALGIIVYVGMLDIKMAVLLFVLLSMVIIQYKKNTETFQNTSFMNIPNQNLENVDSETYNKYFANDMITNNTQIKKVKYCIPAGKEGCQSPYQASKNDPSWCGINDSDDPNGDVYCIQKCPPKMCMGKQNGSCPYKGQVTSSDNSNMCCFPDKSGSCSCDPYTPEEGCPPETTCGYTPPPEEEQVTCETYTYQKCVPKVTQVEESEIEYTPYLDNGCPTTTTNANKRDETGELKKTQTEPEMPSYMRTKSFVSKLQPVDPYINKSNQYYFKRNHPINYNNNYDDFISI